MKHRGIAMGKQGMVASAHSLISSTGINILRKGGNAIDAACAMANTSGVVLPDMCGLGGDAFLLYYEASTKKVYAINGSGAAPKAATIDYYKKLGYKTMPSDGMLSVTIPGQLDAIMLALEKFGTMEFKELVDDAISLANNGCPISEKVARHIVTDYDKVIKFKGLREMLLKNGDKPKEAGDIYYNPDYAKTLQLIADGGKEVFYSGAIAEKIVAHAKNNAGLISKEDLLGQHAYECDPINVNYRDYVVWQTPPVSQGIIHLEELNILNQFDLSKYKNDSWEAIHLMVEAKKIAFADRIKYFGDPKNHNNPIEKILSEEYAKEAAKKISMDKSLDTFDLVDYDDNGHTTSFVVVDKYGNACSFIHSIANTWGSGEIVEGTGILLNNRGAGFNLISGHPNCLQPGKRTMHTLITYLITDGNGNLRYVGNTPGGDNQPQWNLQVVTNVIDFKMDVQSAVEACKWCDAQSSNIATKSENILKIEETAGKETLSKLKEVGHKLNVIDAYTCSGASQIIEIKENGILFGGSDPRADGCAIGY
ncbi:MAG: gamma-glutamyltransferase [Erysipelotrichaceae bacterium]|nr:gamma-glutamyltransferase [Erysipelotrichaceae bacterium]MDY5252743.1 gamma-glutamyltransferase [Erysipelotrichaceae bacterium]